MVAENFTFPWESIPGPSSMYTDYAIPTHEDVLYVSKVFAARSTKILYKYTCIVVQDDTVMDVKLLT